MLREALKGIGSSGAYLAAFMEYLIMNIEIKPFLEIKAEEIYPACPHCNSILFDNYFETDPTLDDIRDWLESVKDLERNREEIRFVVWDRYQKRALGWLAVTRVDDVSDVCCLSCNFCDMTRYLELMVETSRYAIDYAFNAGFTSEVFIESHSGDTVIRKLLEEIPLEISFTDTVACEHVRPEKEYFYSIHVDDPARNEWFSKDGNQCSRGESDEYSDCSISERISIDLSQDEINYFNSGSEAPRGLS